MYCHLFIMTGHVYLVARVSSATLDSLAAFEIDRADLEPDGNDEPEERDQHLGGSHATDQTGWGTEGALAGHMEDEHDGAEPEPETDTLSNRGGLP
jgi:hypothetical protein